MRFLGMAAAGWGRLWGQLAPLIWEWAFRRACESVWLPVCCADAMLWPWAVARVVAAQARSRFPTRCSCARSWPRSSRPRTTCPGQATRSARRWSATRRTREQVRPPPLASRRRPAQIRPARADLLVRAPAVTMSWKEHVKNPHQVGWLARSRPARLGAP